MGFQDRNMCLQIKVSKLRLKIFRYKMPAGFSSVSNRTFKFGLDNIINCERSSRMKFQECKLTDENMRMRII